MSRRPRRRAYAPPLRRTPAFAAVLGLVALAGLLFVVLAAAARTPPAAARTPPAASRTSPLVHLPVPHGFVGVDIDGPLTGQDPPISLARQMPEMVAAGVQSIRIAFNWAAAEPFASWARLPEVDRGQYADVRGVPVDFQTTDDQVAAAARAHVSVLPTVLYAPAWDGVRNPAGVAYPRRDGPYAAYLTALIGRYGPHGSFWASHPSVPRRPIREWQIWNEPNLLYYWGRSFARGYDGLLGAAHAAIKRADPGAKVVLGALTNRAWKSYAQLYAADHHVGRLFDVAAVNGFTKVPANVIVYLRYVRDALNRYGAYGRPMIATEVSWPSAAGKTNQRYTFDTTETGQARNIASLLPLLGVNYRTLGLVGFDYYTWMGSETRHAPAFAFAGLLAYANTRVRAKPALAAFRRGVLTLERCRAKGAFADVCRH